MKLRVLATGRSTYPDASMVCGPIELDPADASGTTITNPSLLDSVCSSAGETIVASFVALSVSARITIAPAIHTDDTVGCTRKRIVSPGCCRSLNQLPRGARS